MDKVYRDGMQKVCKQGRDDMNVKINIQSSIPTSSLHHPYLVCIHFAWPSLHFFYISVSLVLLLSLNSWYSFAAGIDNKSVVYCATKICDCQTSVLVYYLSLTIMSCSSIFSLIEYFVNSEY